MSILKDTLARMIKDARFQDIPFARNLFDWWLNDESHTPLSLAERAKLGIVNNPDPDDSHTDPEGVEDMRFLRVMMHGIRRFPSRGRIQQSGIGSTTQELKVFYGIDFGKGRQVKSKVMLGSNGVGKSSVYSSLEQICLGHTYSADLRGYIADENQIDYLCHLKVPKENAIILLDTTSSNYRHSLADKKRRVIPYDSCFCMEYDIEELSKSIDEKYIVRQLGLFDYHMLLEFFEDLNAGYNKTNDSYEKAIKRHRDNEFVSLIYSSLAVSSHDKLNLLQDTAKQYSNVFEKSEQELKARKDEIYKDLKYIWISIFPDRNVSEIWKASNYLEDSSTLENRDEEWPDIPLPLLIQSIDYLCKTILKYTGTADAERINEQLNKSQAEVTKIIDDAPLCGISENRYSEFTKVYNYLLDNYIQTLETAVKKGETVFPILMKDYFKTDISNIQLSLKDKSIKVEISACDPANRVPLGDVDPRKYLNTFRFKIYCVALKISLAFTSSQLYGINTPIVIDDVFDSSDFANREMIRSFISHIFEAHEKIFGHRQELQLIFFTQDDVIADSVYRGIANHQGFDKVEYSRIYDYTECEDSDEEEIEKHISGENPERIIKITIDQRIR